MNSQFSGLNHNVWESPVFRFDINYLAQYFNVDRGHCNRFGCHTYATEEGMEVVADVFEINGFAMLMLM